MPPCQNYPTSQPAKLASIINKNPKFKKMSACSHYCSLWHEHRQWALVYRGIPSDLRSSPEQSHHLPGVLLPWWQETVCRVSNGRSHLQLYRKGASIHKSNPLVDEFIYPVTSAEWAVSINRPMQPELIIMFMKNLSMLSTYRFFLIIACN